MSGPLRLIAINQSKKKLSLGACGQAYVVIGSLGAAGCLKSQEATPRHCYSFLPSKDNPLAIPLPCK